MRIYRVGGTVRDRLLGRPSPDEDFVVLGGDEPELRRRVGGLVRVGRDLPVFVQGARQYTFSPAAGIEDDLATRDLTVNALAEAEDGRLFAHPLALSDLRDRILRPVAAVNFLADPLRAIRAARFAAVFPDFTVHPDLLAAMLAVPAPALGQVAAERVGQETLKACAGTAPGNFLRVLAAGRCLLPWFREFDGADMVPAGPPQYHDASILEHTARVMDRCAGQALDAWMALCHDLGKTATEPSLLPRHPEHEIGGVPLAEGLALRLRLPNSYRAAGRLAARWHMAAGRYGQLRPATRIRLLLELDLAGVMEGFFRLIAADGGGDHLGRAAVELARVKAVRLPDKHRDQGEKSAEVLLQLRCEALSGR